MTTLVCTLLLAVCFPDDDPSARPDGIRPVPFHQVEITSEFWRPRLERQRSTLVPIALQRTQPAVEHLSAARDFLQGKPVPDHRPHRYVDSDLYKVIEGASYLLRMRRDPDLESKLDELAELIAAAQAPDGYLYPSHITGVGSSKDMMGDRPYEYVVHSHELYNMGHLYEAAVAYYLATGKRTLLDVAEKNAQHIQRVFFEGDPNYNDGKPVNQAPGHEEIEIGLVKLYHTTGNELYLDMARRFLEIRGVTYRPEGEGVMSPTYAQQHAPVFDQTEPVGHAVRAAYLYSAMADVGAATHDPRFQKPLDKIWENLVNTRLHITGGMGAVHGVEGFGRPYELPNADAYNETCAAVGNVLFNYRMFLLHGESKYLDVAEVALLNNVLAGVSLDGSRFFYVNPLEFDGARTFNFGTAGRAEWFQTACCPTNLARLIPQVAGMLYAVDSRDVYVTMFASSRTEVMIDQTPVELSQTTGYPWDGEVGIHVSAEKPVSMRLLLRIPSWTHVSFLPGRLYRYVESDQPATESVQIMVNGKPFLAHNERGFAVIERQWGTDDQVTLRLPMPVRISECAPEVEANRGRVAVTRGPLVYCAEGVDNRDPVQRFWVDPKTSDAATSLRTIEIDGIRIVQVEMPAHERTAQGKSQPARLVLTPYFAWNNRGSATMQVWIAAREELAQLPIDEPDND